MAGCIGLFFGQIHHSDGGYCDFSFGITKLAITNACAVIRSTHTFFPLQTFLCGNSNTKIFSLKRESAFDVRADSSNYSF